MHRVLRGGKVDIEKQPVEDVAAAFLKVIGLI